MTDSVQDIFVDLEESANVCKKSIANFTFMKDVMSTYTADSIFDEEDMQTIESRIQKFTAQYEAIQKELDYKRQLYNETVLKLENILDVRQKVLEEADVKLKILETDEELLNYFARKQAELKTVLENTKRDLLQQQTTTGSATGSNTSSEEQSPQQ